MIELLTKISTSLSVGIINSFLFLVVLKAIVIPRCNAITAAQWNKFVTVLLWNLMTISAVQIVVSGYLVAHGH